MNYYAHAKIRGPILYGRLPCAVGVLGSPDQAAPIGAAYAEGWDTQRRQVWRLVIGKQELLVRFGIIDGAFVPWEGEPCPSPSDQDD